MGNFFAWTVFICFQITQPGSNTVTTLYRYRRAVAIEAVIPIKTAVPIEVAVPIEAAVLIEAAVPIEAAVLLDAAVPKEAAIKNSQDFEPHTPELKEKKLIVFI
jgi:hypothetical protein